MSLAVVLHDLPDDTIDLHGQLASGRDDKNAGAIPGFELGSVQQLHTGYEKGQGFSRACEQAHTCSRSC